MRSRAFVLILLGLALARVPVPVVAQETDSYFGQAVVSVAFDIEGRPETSSAITDISGVRAGQPLRRRDVRATIGHLDSLGRYDDVSVDASAVPGGVAVVFRLVPRHPVTRLEIRGTTEVAAALQDLLRQRYGGVPTGARLSVLESTAVQFLSDEGYVDAVVNATIERVHDPDSATLVLNVQAGALAVIATTSVRGRSPFSVDQVIERTRMRAGQAFRRRAIESALSELEDDLRGRGYYEAQATLQWSRSPAGVDAVITVNPGPLVDVRAVPAGMLPGNLDDLVPIRRLGSADQDLLEDSRARIERALRAQGYWRASAPFTRVSDDAAGRLVITFTIDRGPRFIVDRVDLPASLGLPAATLRALIGVQPGDVFDQDRFLRGLAAVADYYRRNGYYRIAAEPEYEAVDATDAARLLVVLHPNITEGPRGVVGAVTFSLGSSPTVGEAALRATLRSRVGQPYVELDAARDRATLERLYQDRGFRTPAVQIRPTPSADGREVTLAFDVVPGTEIRIGQISIVGLERVSERAIRDELRLAVGDPAGAAALNAAHGRLIAMGVFQRVALSSVDQFSQPATHLLINVVEAPANTFAVGGGVEGGRYPRRVAGGGSDDLLEFAPRASLEVSRRNIGGRNRTASFFSRVSLRRDRTPLDQNLDVGGFGFTEYRVNTTFRERNAFRTNSDLLVGLTSEQAVRTTFNFVRQGVNADWFRQFSPQVSLSGRYNLDFTRLFDEQFDDRERPVIDRAFTQVRLSTLSAGLAWDRRDSPVKPTRGFFASADLETAFRRIGSEVGFVKGFLQASAYRPLDASGRTVVAGRAELGAASGFARTATVIGDDGLPVETTVDDLPASKRFFAGGSTTVRGFQLDRLAVPELLKDGLPLGGNALVVLNAELRRTLTRLFGRNLGGVVFLDSGNVFPRANNLDLGRLRGSAGFGVRYDSPLGPLRLDFGFKIRPQTSNGTTERAWEYHLSVLEAF